MLYKVPGTKGEWELGTFLGIRGESGEFVFGDWEHKLTTAWTARRLAEGEKRYYAEALGDLDGREPSGAPPLELLSAPPLAGHALVVAEHTAWDSGTLIDPIYFRPPAVSRSKKDPPAPPLKAETDAPTPG